LNSSARFRKYRPKYFVKQFNNKWKVNFITAIVLLCTTTNIRTKNSLYPAKNLGGQATKLEEFNFLFWRKSSPQLSWSNAPKERRASLSRCTIQMRLQEVVLALVVWYSSKCERTSKKMLETFR
jgi:hypothetical protein